MRKKIALCISEIAWDYQETISKKVIECANALNYDVVVICAYGSFNDNIMYAEGEKAAISLIDYSSFAGIIATEDLFDVPGMADEFYEAVAKNATCPVVYLRSKREGCYSILIENTASIETMVRHFTDVHGFKNICYMSGKAGWLDTEQRLNGYLNVMKENSIEVTEHMIFHGDFWRKKGAEAVDWFLNGGNTYPEAIVCANDYMALSVINELNKRGIKVPEQVCVSGFDYVDEANLSEPTLTTLALDFNDLASRAVQIIDKVNNGQKQDYVHFASTKMILQGSCGCGKHSKIEHLSSLIARTHQNVNDTKDVMLSAIDYQDSFTPEEFMNVAYKYRSMAKSDKILFCFNNRNERSSEDVENDCTFTSTMRLRDVFDGDKPVQKNNVVFPRKDLLPSEFWSDEKANNYFFFVLHFKNKVYGYMVTELPKNGWFDINTQDYLVNLSNALENSQVHQSLQLLEEIRDLYQRDSLTGIYNRRGFDKLLKTTFDEAKKEGTNFALISIDMDNLKPINDNFGHSAGDNALTVLASTLYRMMTEGDFCGRVGGDEFAAVIQMTHPNRANEFKEQFLTALIDESSKIPEYSVEASVGICEFAENPSASLISMIQIVDERMYAEKRAKKALLDIN